MYFIFSFDQCRNTTSILQTCIGCPKIKLALGKDLDLAFHGFHMGAFYPKMEYLGPDFLRLLLGDPRM